MHRTITFMALPALASTLSLLACDKTQDLYGGLIPDGNETASDPISVSSDETTDETSTETSSQTSLPSTASESHSATQEESSETQATQSDTSSSPQDTGSAPDFEDADSDGWVGHEDMDCNDSDASVNPAAPEVPGNGIDDDCDGKIDETGNADTQGCDGQEFAIEVLPTNLMVLLDMSSSMVTAPPTPTKWEQARAALVTLLSQWDSEINFGLDIFPDDGDCGVSKAVTADVAPGNATNIIHYLNGASPYGTTPLCMALRKMSDTSYAKGLWSGNAASYLVLVSDGTDTCGGTAGICQGKGLFGSTTPSVQQLKDRTTDLVKVGVSTFVIGFGDGVDPIQLNAIAGMGGTMFNTYLDASNQTELKDALASIATTIASCTFELKDPSASSDPDKVNFFFDGAPVPYDPGCKSGNGWDWTDATHTAITFCKNACEQLTTGSVSHISAEFGCDQVAS
ncbi:MAG: VWA domain-containing protein [Myxococcota bacterium]|nr:VWA domain-containing protein [Myxococcota bacterium]